MITRTVFLAAIASAALAGCVPEPQLPTPPAPANDCGAAGLQGLVGQPRSVLETRQFEAPLRLIGPNMAVTADYRADRLNIEYDEKNIITEVSCF